VRAGLCTCNAYCLRAVFCLHTGLSACTASLLLGCCKGSAHLTHVLEPLQPLDAATLLLLLAPVTFVMPLLRLTPLGTWVDFAVGLLSTAAEPLRDGDFTPGVVILLLLLPFLLPPEPGVGGICSMMSLLLFRWRYITRERAEPLGRCTFGVDAIAAAGSGCTAADFVAVP